MSKKLVKAQFGDDISDGFLNNLLRTGRLPYVKVGRRTFVRRADFERFVAELERAT